MVRPIRRVITGHDARGRSVIVSDGPSPNVLPLAGVPSFALTDLWVTFDAPADNAMPGDAAARAITLEPPPRGTIFRVVEFPPDRDYVDRWDRRQAFASMQAGETLDHGGERHPMMHRTATVDYAIVLAGEIWAVMDEGETLLRAGDVLVQRGTNHAWSNRTGAPCLVAFILVSARPLA
jgi:hypothetical protein